MPQYPNEVGFYRDGFYRRNIVQVSTASSRYNIPEEESGAVYHLALASTMNFILPRVSSKWLGLTYEFAIEEQASSLDVRIRCDVNDSSALIKTGLSSIIDENTTLAPNSTFFTGARVTAISSVTWVLEQITGITDFFGTTASDSEVYAWTTG